MPPETPVPEAPLPQVPTTGPCGADAARIAQAACASWQRIDAALSPIIGSKGVAALYRRSLHVAGSAHPCLRAVQHDSPADGGFAALRSVLCAQPAPGAAAAQAALLQTFRDLLSSLIGASLTERLLQPVQESPASGPAIQDTTP